MGINLGNLAALRTFRVLRALKTVAIVPVSLQIFSIDHKPFFRLHLLQNSSLNSLPTF